MRPPLSRALGIRDRAWLFGLTAALLLVIVDVFTHGPLVHLDVWIARLHGTKRWPGLLEYAKVYDKLGQRSVTIPVLLVVAGVLGRRHRTWRPVLLSLWLVVSLNLVVGGMKVLIGRAKPSTGSADVLSGGVIFPSGHSSNMVLTGGLIVYLLKRYADRPRLGLTTGVAAALTTVTVLVSLYRDTHWFTDLIGGALVGGLLLEGLIVMDRVTARSRHRPQSWLNHPSVRWVLGRGRVDGADDGVDAGEEPGDPGGVVDGIPEGRPREPRPDLHATPDP